MTKKYKLNIQRVALNDHKISDIKFEYDQKMYEASVTPSEIRIKGIGVYNRKQDIMLWYLKHCCGAQGFGYSSNDTCPACESKTGVTQSYFGSHTFAPQDFLQLMRIVSKKCNTIEEILTKHNYLL